jgi:5-methylcytosine-specific restriction protein A
MIREILERIGTGYLAAKSEPFTAHPLARFIRSANEGSLDPLLADKHLLVKGGCGVGGGWAAVPWIGIFDPVVTSGAQHGHYLVYLFSADMQRVYLSLNQGTTEVETELGANERALNELRSRAAIMRERAPEFRATFSADPIGLESDRFLPRGYEAGHAFGVAYTIDRLPPEEKLHADLIEAIRLYRILIVRGGTAILSEEDAADAGLEGAPIEEKRRYVSHRKIERNPKAAKEAKRVHGTTCQGCDFDFAAIYGTFGAGYIEAHHLVPLSSITEGETVTLDPKTDFAVLCANCHRMMHRKGGPTTVAELKAIKGVGGLRELLAAGRNPRLRGGGL